MGMPKSRNRQKKDKYMMCMMIRNRKNEEKGYPKYFLNQKRYLVNVSAHKEQK